MQTWAQVATKSKLFVKQSIMCLINWGNKLLKASMRGIEIQKAIQGKTVFIKWFFNGWSNRNDSFGRPPWKLDADEMLKKISPLAHLCARAHLSLRARTCSSSVAPPIAKLPKWDLYTMPKVTQKLRNGAPKSAVRVRALHSLCAPCVHGPIAHQ